MNTSQDTPCFEATRDALVVHCPTTPEAATKFLTTLQPRDFEALATAARSGRNEEQTRALVLVAVASTAASQAMQIAALAGMGVGRLAAEHSVDGRPAEYVNQACELATKALDAAFDAREATKAALAAQDRAEKDAVAAAATAAAQPAVAPPVVAPQQPAPSEPPAPIAPPPAPVETPVAPVETPAAPSPVAEPQTSVPSEPVPPTPPSAPSAPPAHEAPPAAPALSEPTKPKRPTLSG